MCLGFGLWQYNISGGVLLLVFILSWALKISVDIIDLQ